MPGGVNFSIFSKNAVRMELLLFDRDDAPRPTRVIPLDTEHHQTYHYWHVFVPEIGSGQIYGFRAYGPFEPERGLRFDHEKLLLDPYGLAVAVPELKVRVINVVDLMRLQPPEEHPHGLSHKDFDTLFTRDKPIVFAFHGYPWLIHRLTYRRTNHGNLHVRGYKEEGTTTTPFDMSVLNEIDRFHLVGDVIDRVPALGSRAAYAKQAIRDKLIDHAHYIREHGEDMPEIRDWSWSARARTNGLRASSTEADYG